MKQRLDSQQCYDIYGVICHYCFQRNSYFENISLQHTLAEDKFTLSPGEEFP